MAQGTSRRARSENSKEQILQAALRLAVERGYEGTTMADVSAESGLPIGSVYWHFKNKEQLFVELLEHCHAEWLKIHSGPIAVRDKVTRGIAGQVREDPGGYSREEALLKVAMILALDKRLGGLGEDSEVRRTYIRIRSKMFEVNVRHLADSLPGDVVEAFPELPEKLAVLSLALTDGFYVHANSAIRIDFAEYADLAALALEGLVDRYVKLARERKSISTAAG
ncbi:TetR/AcrR family transcriptional regulator [Microbispora catharanthi]|uniref:TetR family transcriptional regulator n=1 Tax=Microbispora catharanthi TaxID=1712871 RepID=A0A5N6BT63_9ACTN|nr:TetR family transcriptional regulator [Microbispora catharanthi]KAB8183679.1 TetR family transcriptional regulator [Microbispora catharanthi]